MIGSLSQVWDYLSTDVWEPLADRPIQDAIAPPDLFSDLFALADDYLAPGPTATELEEARNDPDIARQYFLSLRGTDFASESDIVEFLEEADTVILDYDIPGFDDAFKRLLRSAFKKYNLRYRLDEPFVVRFLLPGWVNFQVMRRTHASLGHQAKVDPKVSADQRGHGIGVAIDVYTKSTMKDRASAVKRIENSVVSKVRKVRKAAGGS